MEARARTRTVLALTVTAAWIILAGTELYTQTMGFVVSTRGITFMHCEWLAPF